MVNFLPPSSITTRNTLITLYNKQFKYGNYNKQYGYFNLNAHMSKAERFLMIYDSLSLSYRTGQSDEQHTAGILLSYFMSVLQVS